MCGTYERPVKGAVMTEKYIFLRVIPHSQNTSYAFLWRLAFGSRRMPMRISAPLIPKAEVLRKLLSAAQPKRLYGSSTKSSSS